MGVNHKKVILLSGVLCSKKGKYLMVQEAHDKPYSKCKGKWSLPHGGYDKQGESIKDLAIRELLEETGGKAALSGKYILVEGWDQKHSSLVLVSTIWEACKWKKIDERIVDEIKAMRFFSLKKIFKLIENNKIRDNFPIMKVINYFEGKLTGTIRWDIDLP